MNSKYKYNVIIILLSLLLFLSVNIVNANINQSLLTDIQENSWYYPAVQKLINLNIINGYPDNTFKPNNYITRAEMAQTVSNLLDYTDTKYNQPNYIINYENHEVDMIANTIPLTAVVVSDTKLGGGVLVGDKHILTAYHNIGDINNIKVTLGNGGNYDGRVIKFSTAYDLALIELSANQNFKYINLAKNAYLAETVFTIGSPRQLHFTVTKGIISSLNRKVGNMNYNQIDAAASPGSSGGVVVNSKGELVGIVISVATNANGVTFMARLEDVKEFLER